MFLKVKLTWNVVGPAKGLYAKGLMLQRSIATSLVDDFAEKGATEDIGYLMAVKPWRAMERVKFRIKGMWFSLWFSLESPSKYLVERLWRTGPVDNIHLSGLKMPNYHYTPGENPAFASIISIQRSRRMSSSDSL
ncbi:DNA-directed RNA polymerase V subunit 7-like [Durio zibethinus]|uniref:DNA-directed RNA polymerase V subunit 7-like n=1 Tax=Durio zibethinus TaxID=66656 RepID=A0A6P6BJJ2_DURZI|nr:DNA-directed RNA polymerase V subunit 7-like [Durio zibethinus]